MDDLARDAMAAGRLGVSYGKYKAMMQGGPVERTPVKDNRRRCAHCGRTLPRDSHGGRKYCGDECSQEAHRVRARERYHERKEDGDGN